MTSKKGIVSREKVNYKRKTGNIWFPEQVEPSSDDKEAFKEYWKTEKKRIREGFWIADNQVYISGWLYWYTVYWMMELDVKMPDGKSYKGMGTPVFRDIEFEVAEDLERAEKEQKIYCLVGSRGFGKSNIAGSYVGRMYTFFNNSQSLITAGFSNDIQLLADKIDMGLTYCHPIWHKARTLNNWSKEVRAGWIDAETGLRKGSMSRIVVRNYEQGNNTMATNGTRPKVQIIDEIGKIPNLIRCILDSVPSWMNDYGMFCVVIATGTGGDMEKGEEAGVVFRNPGKYNVLEFEDEWEGTGKIGKFMPVTKARNEYKESWTLYDYLTKKLKRQVNPHPELTRIKIMVSNEEKCLKEFVEPRREKFKGNITSNELIKEKAYYPLTPSESFLVVSQNDFPTEACEQQLQWIRDNNFEPLTVELVKNGDGSVSSIPIFDNVNKRPVRDFPVTADSYKEGVIEVVEHPKPFAAPGLYVAGVDPYKISESDYSDSLGSVYIFKRMTNDMTEPYQYMPVAWYTGRPKDIHTWYENTRNLLVWYNAVAMVENFDYGFIQYMIANQETKYLAEGQSYLKEINPNSKSKSTYGLPPTVATIRHWENNAVMYTKEKFIKRIDENGKPQDMVGVTRILDPMLLTEMIKFNRESGNFDRVRAFSIALSYAKQLDAINPKVNVKTNKRNVKKIPKSPFSMRAQGIPSFKSPFNSI